MQAEGVMATPYRPKVKLGSLRQTTKKMMVTKAAGSKVTDERMKTFLKQDKGLRRVAYGDQRQTLESWRGRKFIATAKDTIESSTEFKESSYGRKTTAAKAFRDTVKEEVRQEDVQSPKGPTAEEQRQQKRLELGKERIHQFQRQLEVEREQGKPLSDSSSTIEPEDRPKATPLVGGGVGAVSAAPDRRPSGSSSVSFGANSGRPEPVRVLPDEFGLRGRVLRVDLERNRVSVKVLNAPPELAILIGRDQALEISREAHFWRDRQPAGFSELVVGDRLDAAGKVLNDQLILDEAYINNIELPDFVVHLGPHQAGPSLPTEPPSDLAIG